MQVNSQNALLLTGFLTVFAAARPASADEQSTTLIVPRQVTDWGTTLLFPTFDPAQGTLTGYRLHVGSELSATAGFENELNEDRTVILRAEGTLTVTVPGAAPVSAEPTAFAPAALDAYDGSTDFSGPSGTSFGNLSAFDSVSTDELGPLPALVGPAGSTVAVGVAASTFITTGSDQVFDIINSVGALDARVTLTYFFDPPADCDGDGTPDAAEPDCDNDGTPDDCEPDCDGDGLPDDCETDSDGDGFPDDCDAEIVSGGGYDQAGSLLLFAQFDHRPGVETLLTVTNTSLDAVHVRFLYIDGGTGNCLEFDRVESLAGKDTFTVPTSVHNPAGDIGFVYVYAVSQATNEPVSFNHLIGSSVTLLGLSGSIGYTAAAASFRSLLPEGQATDLDNDGIRDLDDQEYSSAANELLLPRFIGSSPGAVSNDLILIGLSGGRAFDTTVRMVACNDNEQAFSVEHTFRCWTRVPLESISGVFTTDFLNFATSHDPSENLSGLEYGWLRIVGLQAASIGAVVANPAIWGLVVERSSDTTEAGSLPFYRGQNANGDLFPTGIFGDL